MHELQVKTYKRSLRFSIFFTLPLISVCICLLISRQTNIQILNHKALSYFISQREKPLIGNEIKTLKQWLIDEMGVEEKRNVSSPETMRKVFIFALQKEAAFAVVVQRVPLRLHQRRCGRSPSCYGKLRQRCTLQNVDRPGGYRSSNTFRYPRRGSKVVHFPIRSGHAEQIRVYGLIRPRKCLCCL